MAMQVSGNYAQSRTDYAEKVKEKQAAERAEKAKEAQEAEKAAGEKDQADCPNRRMFTSMVKNQERSLPDCIG